MYGHGTGIGTGKKLPGHPIRMDAWLYPKDLREYLQPLMEGLAEDLAVAIYENQDAFSSGPADMW